MSTGLAKLISATGNAAILQRLDPILLISFRNLFLIAGVLELIVSVICLISRRLLLQVALVASIATIFLIYRFSLLWVGYQRPCPCLGNLTDALFISPQTADIGLKIVLVYLIVGSYAAFFYMWKQRRPIEAKKRD
jgi:hypothetical protein